MTKKIGFIGLGVMGSGMARNIMKAGYELATMARNEAKAEEFRNAGAAVYATPAQIAEQTDFIVTCVPDASAVHNVISGPDGLLDGDWTDGLLIDCSTIAPHEAQEHAELLKSSGSRLIDAPVSGGRKGAEDGTLTIMTGGESDDVARAMPVLEAMGKNIHHLGPLGAGQAVKAANQMMVAVNLMGACEAVALVRAAGVDPRQMCEVLSTGAARSGVLEAHAIRYLDGALEGGFRAELMAKDLGIVSAVGHHHGTVQPAANLAQQMMLALCNGGLGGLDSAALGLLYDRLNGVTVEAKG